MVGEYDNLSQPAVINNYVDYICFTDRNSQAGEYIGVWRLEKVPFKHKDNGRLSRYPKILPHMTVISQYAFSLYIDANLIIKSDYIYKRINELIDNKVKLALIRHPARNCAYQEAYNCIAGCKARWRDLLRQLLFLKRNHFPQQWGLYEANVIFREHNHPEVIQVDDLWWSTFKRYSKRDQLSLVYALWTTNSNPKLFLPEGYSTINHESFERLSHLPQKDTISVICKKKLISIFIKQAKKQLKK